MLKKIHPLLFVPGFIIWPLIIIGAIQDNEMLLGAGIVLAVLMVVVGLIVKGRRFGQERREVARIWFEGRPARGTIVSLSRVGGGMNRQPNVEFELDVTPEHGEVYRVRVSEIIDELAIPRVQPGCEIDLRVDVDDPTRVALDESVVYLKYQR